MADTYIGSGWACVDCLVLLANGEDPVGSMNEAEIAEWHAEIDRRTAGLEITPGLTREEHACATNWTVTTEYGNAYEFRATDELDAREQFESTHLFPLPDGGTVTEHELETDGERGGDDDCEVNSFSWSACSVCGSNLGGERHAVSFWKIGD